MKDNTRSQGKIDLLKFLVQSGKMILKWKRVATPHGPESILKHNKSNYYHRIR